MRSVGERIADVRRLLAAARAVTAARLGIQADLARSTGLSKEGVELAFTRHLELDATDSELTALVGYAGQAESVLVILSANVFVAALRAIALARAASSSVRVRPSRRDPVFARALVDAVADPSLTLAEDADPKALRAGEIHVYGRDQTIAEVRAQAAPGVRVRGHGAGMGAAWISLAANLTNAADALAMDIVAFDQRGCLSPRVALVEGDTARADAFADAVHHALALSGLRVPRGAVSDADRAEAARYVALMQFAGRARVSADHAVGTAEPRAPLIVPPAARCLHVAPAADAAAARALLAPLARFVVAVGADDTDRAIEIAPDHARLSPLGRMQCPPLDGPVDRR